MNRVFAYIALLLIGVTSGIVQAQTVAAEAKISWKLPTALVGGGALTGDNALTRIHVFADTKPIPDSATVPTISLVPTATNYTWKATVPNGSTLYVRARACIKTAPNESCSVLTPQVTRAITISIPEAPTDVKVTVTVTLSTT